MGAKSSIEWTDATWNPIRGCSMAKGSETGGCLNCYAARFNSRNLPGLVSPTTGKPFARILDSGPRWTGDVELIESQLTLPIKWKTPRRIFVNSQSDLFHESLPDEQIDRVFLTMALCSKHTFQILTKRADRMMAYCRRRAMFPDFLPNVWLGVSVENQATAGARIPLLLQTPAAKRFVSYEPALGPVEFRDVRQDRGNNLDVLRGGIYHPLHGFIKQDMAKLDWIIVGGESGPGARPFDITWARSTVQQCKSAGVACFVKQLGPQPYDSEAVRQREGYWPREERYGAVKAFPGAEREFALSHILRDRKGGEMAEWPEDLRVQEFPK